MATYDIDELAEAMGVDPEDLAEELGYESVESVPEATESEWMSFDDMQDLSIWELNEIAEDLAEAWDVDVADVYDLWREGSPEGE